ncbi:hypothetical protein GOODEAATRI_032250, partial [Goodea atripinnis]
IDPATGDSGCLMVEFGDFKGRSMKELYEDQSKDVQVLITHLKKAKARPNTIMALFKAFVLKRQASARAHLPTVTVSAPSTVAAPPSPAATDGCQCKSRDGTGEAFVSFTAGTKDNITSQTPLSKSTAQRQLFTCGEFQLMHTDMLMTCA